MVILFRYKLHIVNSAPTSWIWEGVALGNLGAKVWALANWKSAVVLVGSAAVLRGPLSRRAKLAVFAWPGIALLFLVNCYLAQWADRFGLTVPQLTPGYHYVMYLIAAGHFFFGAGVLALAVKLVQFVRPYVPPRIPLPQRSHVLRALCAMGVSALLFVGHYRSFRVWHGFTRDHTVALKRVQQTEDFAPYYWIVNHAGRDAVFLCNNLPGLFCVAPAGARVVACDPHFMNLYVPYEPREEAREALWRALRERDQETFTSVAEAYGLTHVLAEGEQRDWARKARFSSLTREFSSDQFEIYQWRQLTGNRPDGSAEK